MNLGVSSLLVPASLFLALNSLGAQAPITRPAPPLMPQVVGRGDEVVIYRDRNFDGPAVSVRQDEPNLRLTWTVESARVFGGRWELCERPHYQGVCMALSQDSRSLGHRRVQSVRMSGFHGGWRTLGRTDINRVGWIHRNIDIESHLGISEIRLCAERAQLRLHYARARFTNHLIQQLHVPSQLADGTCTQPFFLTGGRRFLTAVDVTAATVGITVRQGLLRVEGR
jgi:hypothetical protein